MTHALVRPLVLALLLLGVCAPRAFPQAAPAEPALRTAAPAAVRPVSKEAAAIDRLFAAAVKPGGPGVTVAVVRRGQVLHRAAYGLANVELGVLMRPDQVLRIGSVTKQFTSAVILRLAEEGRLAVSDPITRFLPDYPV